MIKKIVLIFFLFFILNTSHSYSANKEFQYHFDYLTTEDGLSSNRIYCIFRDHKGFLWLGSDIGLDRYDGYTFKNYKHNSKTHNSLSNNSVHCIFEDSNNNLWLGTSDGLNLLNRELDSFIVFKNSIYDSTSINSNTITDIYEDAHHNVWITSGFACLNLWIPKTRNFKRYRIPYNKDEDLTHQTRSIAQDSKGRLWLVSFSSELFQFNPLSGRFKSFSNPKINLGTNIKGIFIDKDDEIWIYPDNSGLYKYNIANNSFKIYNVAPDGTGINNASVRDVIQEDQNHILFGVDQGGLNRFNKKTQRFEYIVDDESKENGLNNLGIWSFHKDREGIFYITNSGGGVNYYNPKANKFKLFRHVNNNPNSLSYNFTGCFYEDSEGKIWIGTDGKGLNLFDPKTEKFKTFKHDPSNPYSLKGKVIRSISGDSDNDLWIATWDAGLSRYERKTGRFIHFPSDINMPNSIWERIWYIKVAHNDILWVGLQNSGVILVDKKKGIIKRFKSILNDEKSLLHNGIWFLYEDNQQSMWVCTWHGLSKFNEDDQTFTAFKNIPDKETRAMYIDNNKNIWVGTASQGLTLLDSNGEFVRNYTENDGLPNNIINAIVEDQKDNLWISTNNGISRFNKKSNTFRNYSGSDGLQGNQFFNQSFLKTKSGMLYFGGMNGFNSFHPDSLSDNTNIPQVTITDFLILNKPSLVENDDHKIKHISESKSIILHPNQNIFSLSFTATNLTYPEKNRFAYMLEGFDQDWVYTDYSRRYASYTNLDPGNYIFRLKACNNDGLWNNAENIVYIKVLPPWYKTWFFRLIVVVSAILAFVFIYYIKVSFYKRQQKLLTQMVFEKTRSLEESTIYLEEKQEEINIQKEELIIQKDILETTNDILTQQKQQIVKQNFELEKHRFQLEKLVEERTVELVAAKIKAEESDRLKSAFLANLSHEIRTPMNSIVGFSSLLRDEEFTKEQSANMINIVIKNSESLLMLINDILDLSKIEANQISLTFDDIDLIGVLEEIQNIFSIDIHKKNLILTLNACQLKPGYVLYTDLLRFKQVFINLVNNAIKFTNDGTIEFGVYLVNDSKIEFYVKDSGIGIPNDVGAFIFERFVKIENKDQIFGGTGLGLSICKSLVSLWNGDIWYESVINKGTTFYFSHPIIKN